ncbi:hypothetical protein LPJ78_000334 [Coemansia sp. RSA 989]|nr:hypothetical protein BX667DRAFT_498168 [Coemansia mojavensis]KAJ1750719.1 hypothetical protein LPJ79_002691 [Coemansia sp. RSA 1821]KAJ1868205.1 hypothetical protein LPJ78_000334 [Coemansia sp. RSA 989]KAJ1874790.1 hypothetical protein LPJ55_001263 [Coemansia sp. RSA 990]KAJ2677370.1 hypothetical protein IWW42_000176 [Coemansia sp. RSA 1085]
MGLVRKCLLSLLCRDDAASSGSSTIAEQSIKRPPVHKHRSSEKHHSELTQCTAFELPQPFSDYESYSNASRLYLNMGEAHIFKTFPSDALVPLEDEGVGRLKGVYEAWIPRRGAVTRDRLSGVYTLVFLNSSCCEGTISCQNTSHTRRIRKHYVQCLYAGTGVRRGCGLVGDSPCTGIELWIKGSLPVTGPWVQSMYVPPDERLNKLCLVAAPRSDFTKVFNAGNSLMERPDLTAGPRNSVFELDSDVYIYVCRLSPCSSICYTAASAVRSKSEPPMYEFPRIHRAATISTTLPGTEAAAHMHRRLRSPKPGKTRSVYIHVYSNFAKDGRTRTGGARLMLPSSIQLSNGDGIHLKNVTPAADINIKNAGFDRAQFILIDMPGYQDDSDDARSI